MKFMFIDSQERIKDIEKKIPILFLLLTIFCIKEPNFYNFDEILVIGKNRFRFYWIYFFKASENDIFLSFIQVEIQELQRCNVKS